MVRARVGVRDESGLDLFRCADEHECIDEPGTGWAFPLPSQLAYARHVALQGRQRVS